MNLSDLVAYLTPVAMAVAVLAFVRVSQARSPTTTTETLGMPYDVIPERWVDRLRPLVARRGLVAAWATIIIGGNVLASRSSDSSTLALLIAMWVGIFISRTIRRMADGPSDLLDERMLATRNEAFHTAHYMIGGLMTVAAFAAAFSGDGINLSRTELLSGAFTLALLVTQLPAAIIAWNETRV